MKKYILLLTASFIAVIAAFTPLTVRAQTPAPGGSGGGSGLNVFDGACKGTTGVSGSASDICGANKQDDFSNLMTNIINTILLVLGMIAVLMIIIGGIRYTTSNGESAQITAAKNTILYSVVGLVIAILSFAIVNFVLARLGS